MNDAHGKLIQLGDEVVVSQRYGAGIIITFGEVIRLTEKMVEFRRLDNPALVKKCDPHSLTVVPQGSYEFARDRAQE